MAEAHEEADHEMFAEDMGENERELAEEAILGPMAVVLDANSRRLAETLHRQPDAWVIPDAARDFPDEINAYADDKNTAIGAPDVPLTKFEDYGEKGFRCYFFGTLPNGGRHGPYGVLLHSNLRRRFGPKAAAALLAQAYSVAVDMNPNARAGPANTGTARANDSAPEEDNAAIAQGRRVNKEKQTTAQLSKNEEAIKNLMEMLGAGLVKSPSGEYVVPTKAVLDLMKRAISGLENMNSNTAQGNITELMKKLNANNGEKEAAIFRPSGTKADQVTAVSGPYVASYLYTAAVNFKSTVTEDHKYLTFSAVAAWIKKVEDKKYKSADSYLEKFPAVRAFYHTVATVVIAFRCSHVGRFDATSAIRSTAVSMQYFFLQYYPYVVSYADGDNASIKVALANDAIAMLSATAMGIDQKDMPKLKLGVLPNEAQGYRINASAQDRYLTVYAEMARASPIGILFPPADVPQANETAGPYVASDRQTSRAESTGNAKQSQANASRAPDYGNAGSQAPAPTAEVVQAPLLAFPVGNYETVGGHVANVNDVTALMLHLPDAAAKKKAWGEALPKSWSTPQLKTQWYDMCPLPDVTVNSGSRIRPRSKSGGGKPKKHANAKVNAQHMLHSNVSAGLLAAPAAGSVAPAAASVGRAQTEMNFARGNSASVAVPRQQ